MTLGQLLSTASLALFFVITSSSSIAADCDTANVALMYPTGAQTIYSDTLNLTASVSGAISPNKMEFYWSQDSQVPSNNRWLAGSSTTPTFDSQNSKYIFTAPINTTVPRNTSIYLKALVYCAADNSSKISAAPGFSISLTNSAPVVSQLVFDRSRYASGVPVTVSVATIQDNRDPLGSISLTYSNGSGSLGGGAPTIVNGKYQWTISGLPTGTWTFTVRAYDSPTDGTAPAYADAQGVVTVAVDSPPSVGNISVSSGSGAAVTPTSGGYTVTPVAPSTQAVYQLRVSASDVNPSNDSVDRVDFKNLANPSQALASFRCSLDYCWTSPNMSAGTYQYTATAYDTYGVSTQSATVTVVVNNPPTVQAVTSTAPGGVVSAPGAFTLKVGASDPDAGDSLTVKFYSLNADGSFSSTVVGTGTTTGCDPQTYCASLSNVAPGIYQYGAEACDTRGGCTRSTVNVTVRVNTPPIVALTSPVNNATLPMNASISLAATARDMDGAISKVEFYRGTTLINTVSNGRYAYSDNAQLAPGSYTYTAKAYDDYSAVTTSAPIIVTVLTPPTVKVTAPVNNAAINTGTSITLRATASSATNTLSQVQFYDSSALLGTATLSGSDYVYTVASPAAGRHIYWAKATDANAAGTSLAVNVWVANAADSTAGATPAGAMQLIAMLPIDDIIIPIMDRLPAVSLTSPANLSTFNAPAAITLAATASDTDGSVAKVEFYNGTTLLGTVTTAPYTWALSNLAAGTYTFSARAYDNVDKISTSATSTVLVNAGPSVTLAASATSLAPNQNVTLTATPVDGDGMVTRVEFYDGPGLLGTANVAPYTWTVQNLPVGQYSYTARSYDNNGADGASNTVVVTVASTNQPPTFDTTAPFGAVKNSTTSAIDMTAKALDADGTVALVEFYNGSTVLGTAVPNSSGVATLTYPASGAAPNGVYRLNAKAIDNRGSTAWSGTVMLTIGAVVPPSVQWTAPGNNTFQNLSAQSDTLKTLTLQATAADSDGTISKVEFYDGGSLLGSVTSAANGVYSLTSGFSVGKHYLWARAIDNSSMDASTTFVTVTVEPYGTTTPVQYNYDELGRLIGVTH